MPEKVTHFKVIEKIGDVTGSAIKALNDYSTELHEQGYHKYSTHVSNMAWRIEKSAEQTVDQILEDQK